MTHILSASIGQSKPNSKSQNGGVCLHELRNVDTHTHTHTHTQTCSHTHTHTQKTKTLGAEWRFGIIMTGLGV